jgi:hypothetical protein
VSHQRREGIAHRREWPAATDDLEHHDPERVDIGAVVDADPTRLLGRHVLGRPEHHAGLRLERREASFGHQLREPEIEQLDLGPAVLARQQEDVVGLEVAVHEALVVRRDQRRRGLVDHRRGLARVQRATLEPLAQRLADQQVLTTRAAILECAKREDVDDVRVADPVDRAPPG